MLAKRIYRDFLSSGDTLRIYAEGRLVFTSARDRLSAILDYLEKGAGTGPPVTVMDRVVGRAAALLAIRAGCREIYSPLGSRLAEEALDEQGVAHFFDAVVPHIRNAAGTDICPMEKLSLGKNPEQFYALMKAKMTGAAP